MRVVNVHQRLLHAPADRVGELLASLGSPADRLWPQAGWPRMKLDRALEVGARGGHGPIRYRVVDWEPARVVRFRFERMPGIDGWHQFEILDATPSHCLLEHRIEANFRGRAALWWLAVIRPLHDACVEDVLSQAQASLGDVPRAVPRSPYVRALMRGWGLLRSRRRTKGPHVA